MGAQNSPILTDLSPELLCHILQYLPLQDVLCISMQCKKLLAASSMHLYLCKDIDFCEDKIYAYMPSSITDEHMHILFKKCPHLEIVYGLHPLKVERRRLRKRSTLTVPGIIEALSLCGNLKSIETSDLKLLEAIMQHLPQIKIIGHFQNRDGMFPPHASQRLKLLPYPRISSLHLTGVEVPELTAMPHLEHLHLLYVRFTKIQPFRAFLATKLKTFVMKHCMGPTLPLRYLSLIIALSSSPFLSRMELVRVPLPGGLFQRAVEDSYRHNGFVNLKTLVVSGCKGVFEADMGHLMIASSKILEKVYLQSSLTRDSLFVSLSFAECEFPKLKTIHLGYVDKIDFTGNWTNDALLSHGLADVPDAPSSLTDSGMKVISQLFPNIKNMTVSNCPHLMAMDQWAPINGEPSWKELTDLTLQRCHCLQLPSFALFLAFLPKIEVVILNDMFREPPKGCSHVGLSAGTGLGMSSAVVSNQDEHIAVQGHQQDFDLHPDEFLENDEMEREFMDIDADDNPDQHFRILQQEFFDEENDIAPAAVAIQQDRPEVVAEVAQDVAENQIRRELNMDYDPDFNEDGNVGTYRINASSCSEDDDFTSDDDCGPVISSDDPWNCNPDGTPYICTSRHCPWGCNSNDISRHEDTKDGDERYSNGIPKKSKSSKKSSNHHKDTSQNLDMPGSSKDVNENNCHHRWHCEKNCSSSFDPNQPSTSKGGNCFDCSCLDVGEASSCVKRELSSDEEDFKHEEKPPSDDCVKEDELLFIDDHVESEFESKSEAFQGPLTRRRKRVLNRDSESSQHHPDGNSKSTIPSRNRKKLKKSSAETTSIGSNNKPEMKKEVENCEEISLSEKNKKCKKAKKSKARTASEEKKYKKRKKHKHKKWKKLAKCYKKTSHRKGPVTRSRNYRLLDSDFNTVSQGTQATSADIRRCLRRQRNSSQKCKKRPSCGSSHRHPHNQISAREQFKRPKSKSHGNFENKSTSTSDPLMEDDAIQTLRLVSETLISLTIIACGISDIVIDHCHSMTHVEVQACRILKIFQLHYCPSLKRLNVSQCPKLALDTIIPDVISLVATRKLLVSFEPCLQSYYPADTEKAIFSRAPLDQALILFHDFTSSANEAMQARVKESLMQWMEVVQNLYYTPGFWLAKYKKKKIKSKEAKNRYPYGHCLRRVYGMFTLPPSLDPTGTKWRYQIVTNDHAFASALETVPWVSGFPAPETGRMYTEDAAVLSMIKTEIHEKSLKMRKKITSFYVPLIKSNFCDV